MAIEESFIHMSNIFFQVIKKLHERTIFDRRTHVLSTAISGLIPPGSSVLDIGCGTGQLANMIMQHNAGISIRGVEVSARPSCLIEYSIYNGVNIPHDDNSFDVCMFVDVLHHALQIQELLRDAKRVSRRYILIKDHLCESSLDRITLALMDWVGNRPHKVVLPYNYLF